MQPYRQLLLKVRACLQVEAKLAPDEKKANEWIITVSFNGTKVIVGKGDVNTIFYQFGEGKRKVCYPDEMLTKLERMAQQEYWTFQQIANKKTRTFFSETAALKQEAHGAIIGVRDGASKTLYRARPILDGKTEWVKV